MRTYVLTRSSNKAKKWMVTTPTGTTIHFGAAGYSDYTIHKDRDRMLRYRARHEGREDWTAKGINTAGFWALYILWNKPSLTDSIRATERRFNIKIVKK